MSASAAIVLICFCVCLQFVAEYGIRLKRQGNVLGTYLQCLAVTLGLVMAATLLYFSDGIPIIRQWLMVSWKS